LQNIRTDLAMEAFQTSGKELDGVLITTDEKQDFTVTTVTIKTHNAAKRLNKEPGVYLTYLCQEMPYASTELCDSLSDAISQSLRSMIANTGEVLVIGLGNRYITADALGTKVTESILVTRHMKGNVADELTNRLRGVCAVAPGVLGITGMETAEVVKGLVDHVKPSAVIAIDALAAMNCDRIGTTIQITDTGITPGSGVGNHRLGLTKQTLGVPVIAVGVPMVVYASIIVKDILNEVQSVDTFEKTNGAAENMGAKAENSTLGNMVVTPREIDAMVSRVAGILSAAINQALQPQLKKDEILAFMH